MNRTYNNGKMKKTSGKMKKTSGKMKKTSGKRQFNQPPQKTRKRGIHLIYPFKTQKKRIRLNPEKPIKNIIKPKCHPKLNNKRTVTDKSCFTEDVIQKIKQSYNHNHPNNPVVAKDPSQVWSQLRQRLDNKCSDKERCWLNELPQGEREKIEEDSFITKKPKEWSKDPNSWLSNYDIKDVLKDYEEAYPDFILLGPVPINFNEHKNNSCVSNQMCHFQLKQYLEKGKERIAVVFNTDKDTGPGKHWISLFIDLREKFMMFFDSGGSGVRPQILEFMEKVKEQAQELGIKLEAYDNKGAEHQQGETECGMYSLFFIITMLLGRTEFHGNKMSRKEKLDLFLHDFNIPDEYVQKYRDIYFDKDV
jgi:hypothetical protein